jgi:hypothetical protein
LQLVQKPAVPAQVLQEPWHRLQRAFWSTKKPSAQTPQVLLSSWTCWPLEQAVQLVAAATQSAQFGSQGLQAPVAGSLNCEEGQSEAQRGPDSEKPGRQAVQAERLEQAAQAEGHRSQRSPLTKEPGPQGPQLPSSDK